MRPIKNSIYEIRGKRVLLEFVFASLYEVATCVLNQSVKRNIERLFKILYLKLLNLNGITYVLMQSNNRKLCHHKV